MVGGPFHRHLRNIFLVLTGNTTINSVLSTELLFCLIISQTLLMEHLHIPSGLMATFTKELRRNLEFVYFQVNYDCQVIASLEFFAVLTIHL